MAQTGNITLYYKDALGTYKEHGQKRVFFVVLFDAKLNVL